MYNLLIKGGRVIDPARNIDDKLDVAISGDKIATVAKDISPAESQQVVDARDKIVTPGLIDLHCHVYEGVLRIGIDPDVAGVKQGVTTVVDAGSAGQANFGGFPKYVIPSARTTIFCFLHLDSQGLLSARGIGRSPEMREWGDINAGAIAATIKSNRDVIKGIKLRMVGDLITNAGLEVVKMAKKFGLPIMVHIGDPQGQIPLTFTQEFLPLMEPGDILSHVFTSHRGGILRPDGTVLPELKEAMERGVVLDIAQGTFNLSFAVARKSMAQGILPTTLSTDLSTLSLTGPVYGMTVVMSKFMALGLELKQIIEMSTINPARALSVEDRWGSLKPGTDADISILELLSGTWKLEDSVGKTITATKLIAPSMTIKSGQLIPAQPVTQPQPID